MILVNCVDEVRKSGSTDELFNEMSVLLKMKMEKPICVEDTLWLMFLKMKGRQEMTFSEFSENDMKLVCKPVEYLIEADLFF